MKRLILFALILMGSLGAANVFAQSSVLATLSHEGTITTYYGSTALKSALDEAVDGDIITLSPGSFQAADINLDNLTIRGAGFELDPETQTQPTVIVGNFNIGSYLTVRENITIEGIYHNDEVILHQDAGGMKNLKFVKCRLNKISPYANAEGQLENALFINCKILGSFLLYEHNSNATLLNCIVNSPKVTSGGNSSFNFENCIIRIHEYYYNEIYNTYDIHRSTIKNCIIDQISESMYFNSTISCFNNLDNRSIDLFRDACINSNNSSENDFSKVFKSYTGEFTDDTSFELTEEAKKKYLGTDGTEIGIYGGAMPFDPIPSNPRITKLNVAKKSTTDGKLSVDITVKGLE